MLKFAGKIPIRIHPLFWLLAVVIGWLNSDGNPVKTAIWTLIILISVLIHEFGHALTALAFGQKARIDLVGFGGLTHRHGGKLKFWQEFLIVLNGPLFGLLLSVIAYVWLIEVNPAQNSLYRYGLQVTVLVNVFWTILNLLPVYPLDGGHLLRIILEGLFGYRGLKIALFLSLLIGVALSIFFFLGSDLLIGAIFLLFAFESYRAWQGVRHISEKDQDLALQLLLKGAEKDMRAGNKEEALSKLQEVRQQAKQGVLFLTATEIMAQLLKDQGRLKEAYEILFPIKAKLEPDALQMLHKLAFDSGEYHSAIEIGDRVYQIRPTYETALTNAMAYSLLNNVRPAIGWLKRAISDGMTNPKAILSKKEFDPIRPTPQFQQLEKEQQI